MSAGADEGTADDDLVTEQGVNEGVQELGDEAEPGVGADDDTEQHPPGGGSEPPGS